jgi:carnitine 3-dehydrogenase
MVFDGNFLTFHLAGGKAGMRHMLEQFGPALKLPWTKLKAPTLSNKLIDRLVQGLKNNLKENQLVKFQILEMNI